MASAKIALPRVQLRMLRRPHLLEMVDSHSGTALAMVNAAIGYGKTTLLRLWCIESSEPVVWMTDAVARAEALGLLGLPESPG